MQSLGSLSSLSRLGKGGKAKAWFKNVAYNLNSVAPTLIYDFVRNRYYNSVSKSLPFPFSSTRSTNAMQFDSAGNLVWAPANLCLNSTPGATGWTVAAAGTTCNTTGNRTPRGGAEAKLIAGNGVTLNANDGNGSVNLTTNITVASGNTLCYSFDAKAGEVTSLRVRENISTGARIIVDLTDGSVVAENGSNSITAGILVTATDIGNGWYRIIVKRTVTTTTFDVELKPGDTTGDGVSGLYIGSVQIELNDATAPKPFIETTGTVYYGPRFDFAPNAGAARGLLIEDACTNDITASQSISAVGLGASSTGGTYLGGWVAARYTADGTPGTHFLSSGSVTPTASQVRRVQAFIKIVTGTRIQLSTSTQHAPAGAYININSGSIVATGADASNAFCIAVGDDMYWCGFTYTAIGVPAAGGGVVMFTIATDSDVRASNNSSAEVFDVMFMMNAAGSGLTSPVLTTAAAATKAADLVTTPVGGWYSQTVGTFYTDAEFANSATLLYPLATQIDDATANNRIQVYNQTSTTDTRAGLRIDDSAVTQVNMLTANGVNFFNRAKLAALWQLNNTKIVQNGGAVNSDVIATIPGALTTIRMGGGINTVVGMRWLREVRYYSNASASDAQLQTLTT